MRSFYLLLRFLSFYLTIHAQQKYTIRGKIEMRSKSRNIHIDRNMARINSDGTFEISGEVPESHIAFIYTDSSGADDIWLDTGTYTIDCRESALPGVKSLSFRTTMMNGPRDAELYNDFKSKVLYNDNVDRTGVLKYIASMFRYFPDAAPLYKMLIGAHYNMRDSVTEKYIGMLPRGQENNFDVKMLEGEIKRNTKIKTEKSFEAFSMKTADGEVFQLSSLKGKKAVILDFWASDCAPCRAAHPGLIELYKKYKSKGLEIVSISIDSKRDAWLGAIAKDGIDPWINASELQGFESTVLKDYYISYIPYHFLLDGDRKIIREYAGGAQVTESDIEEALHE